MGVRIRTDDYPHRETVIDGAADLWDTNRTEAIVKSCEHAVQSAEAHQDALMYLAQILPPEELLEVTNRLSSHYMSFSVEIQVERDRTSPSIQPELELDSNEGQSRGNEKQ